MTVNLGIIGTGNIANVIAKTLAGTKGIALKSILSRSKENAKIFAQKYDIPDENTFCSLKHFLDFKSIDAVYVATPTSTREKYCSAVIQSCKHLLAEKPFESSASLEKLLKLSTKNKVVMLDATQFIHHPRTKNLIKLCREPLNESLGNLQHIRANFNFPNTNQDSGSFNPILEPDGVLGDLGWYPIRASVALLPVDVKVNKCASVIHSKRTITRMSGLVEFSNTVTLNFDVSYMNNCVHQSLELIGDKGTIYVEDFVLPWGRSFVYNMPDHTPNYYIKQGYTPTKQSQTIVVDDNSISQQTRMLEYFSKLVKVEAFDAPDLLRYQEDTFKTMLIIDQLKKNK